MVIAGEEVLRARFMIYLADAAFAPAVMVKGKALLEEAATQGAEGVWRGCGALVRRSAGVVARAPPPRRPGRGAWSGGRPCGPTPLRCSRRGRAAELAPLTAFAQLGQRRRAC